MPGASAYPIKFLKQPYEIGTSVTPIHLKEKLRDRLIHLLLIQISNLYPVKQKPELVFTL